MYKLLTCFLLLAASFFLLPIAHTAGSGADPTRPAFSTTSKTIKSRAQKLKLQSILISPLRSIAIINGKSLYKGDRISGYRLVDIESDHVRLEKGAMKKKLKLLPADIKSNIHQAGDT